ncbi:hypothetical protein KUV85_12345 [Nocardioides panacisoli]|uniref:hypothetical protein n=1 Tax=Nocardioides panacisoli TaxID=627624 RepID=UPI001C632098|nr:hypothetical protein [Nocardioides panacisoli]QYJ03122.1 hypothetical protein KUV85_12345 [Nocardioides panacisoli]
MRRPDPVGDARVDAATVLAPIGAFFVAFHLFQTFVGGERLGLAPLAVVTALLLGSLVVERRPDPRAGAVVLVGAAAVGGVAIPVLERLVG